MKFTAFDKFLLVLLALCIIVISAACIGVALDLINFNMLAFGASVITNGMIENRLILSGIGIVLLAIALRMFVAMGNKREPRTEPLPKAALMLNSENGTAYITVAAIDSLVQRHCHANGKIRECESLVIPSAEPASGISIRLRLSVAPETVIPELSAQLQQSLKEYIQTLCGISVIAIDILVIPTAVPKAIKG